MHLTVPKAFLAVTLGDRVLLASGGSKPGALLKVPQYPRGTHDKELAGPRCQQCRGEKPWCAASTLAGWAWGTGEI